ncbi:hypothetical protein HaLaN_32901, partial [Haematococcus lacustris]
MTSCSAWQPTSRLLCEWCWTRPPAPPAPAWSWRRFAAACPAGGWALSTPTTCCA